MWPYQQEWYPAEWSKTTISSYATRSEAGNRATPGRTILDISRVCSRILGFTINLHSEQLEAQLAHEGASGLPHDGNCSRSAAARLPPPHRNLCDLDGKLHSQAARLPGPPCCSCAVLHPHGDLSHHSPRASPRKRLYTIGNVCARPPRFFMPKLQLNSSAIGATKSNLFLHFLPVCTQPLGWGLVNSSWYY